MQALKGLVIGMGALIVLGMILLLYGLYSKTRTDAPDVAKVERVDNTPRPVFGDISVPLPAGCVIGDAQFAKDSIMLMITGPVGKCPGVVIVDAGDGRILGTIRATIKP